MGSGGAKPAVAMVVVEFVFSALQIFIKLALDDGMDVRVLVAYRLMFASAFLCPLAFLVERKKRPPLTMKVVLGLFLCGLFGIAINQNLLVLAMKLTNSTTIVTALSNLTPQSTFIVAILTRQEIVKLGKASGRAKLAGTLVGLGGAMVVTFYRGPELAFMHWLARVAGLQRHGLDRGATAAAAATATSAAARILGSFLAISSCFSYAVWLSIQAGAKPSAGRGGLPVPLLQPIPARALLPPRHGALEARARRQALLVGVRGPRGVRVRVPADVLVPAEAGASVRGHVRPAHHRLRRGAQLRLPRRDLAPRHSARRRPDRGRAVHGAVGQSERSAGESCRCSAPG